MTVPPDALGHLRREIDALDGELVALLRRRVRLAGRVATVKERLGLPRRDAAREREVTRRALGLGRGSLDERGGCPVPC